MNEESIDIRFSYHAPTPENVELHEDIRGRARHFAHFLNDNVDDCPELVHALNKLDSCVMWANAAVARTRRE